MGPNKFIAIATALWCFSATASALTKPIKIGGGAVRGGYNTVATILKKTGTKNSLSPVEIKIISTGGSVTNIKAIKYGEFSAGIAQANIADSAFRGTELFTAYGPVKDLRAVARLYPEYVHFVVKADSPITSIYDLKGKHVGLGSAGSGTLNGSVKILHAYGIKELDVKGHYSRITQTIEQFKKGKIDAFFFITASPSSLLEKLHKETPIRLVSIDGNPRDQFLMKNRRFVKAMLTNEDYGAKGDVHTISVSAQLFVNKKLDDDHVYKLTKNLWESPLKDGDTLRLDRGLALNGLAAPLHPGAARYYREQRILRN